MPRGREQALARRSQLQAPPLGGRARAFLDQPLPTTAHSLGEEARELRGHAPVRVWHHRLGARRPTGIGSNTTAGTFRSELIFSHQINELAKSARPCLAA